MHETGLLKRMGATPGKLIAVGVLAVVLAGTIALQWEGSAATAPGAPAADLLSPVASRSAAAGEGAALRAKPEKRPWPKLPLEEIVAKNPFLLPVGVRPLVGQGRNDGNSTNRQDANNRKILRDLSEAESGIVLLAGEEHVARIGATKIRTGDKIGAYRVSKIDASGLWLVDESLIPE